MDQESSQRDRDRWSVYGIVRPKGNYHASNPERKPDSILLISDVDATMTGSNDSLRAFNDFWVKEEVPRGSCLVYNTARPSGYGSTEIKTGSSFVHLVRSRRYDLVQPDILITCEGTEIFWFDKDDPDAEPVRDMDWHSHLGEFWSQEDVESRLEPFDEGLSADLGVIGSFNAEDCFRYGVTLGDQARAQDLAERAQKDLGPHYTVFWSEAWVRGIFLVTALPASAGKGNAAEYVASQLEYPLDRTFWAADSDNDLPMLDTHVLRGIVVGNSFSERLRDAASEDINARVYQAHNSFAAGVLEGLSFFRG